MTTIIMDERDHTMKLIGDARTLAYAVLEADSDRESEGLGSIYPRDLGITSSEAYLSYLQKQGYITALPKTGSSMRIANLSRSDSTNSIFVISIGTMRDTHNSIFNLGGYPHYKKGFVSIRKDGHGQFYTSSVALAATGQEPAIQPYFLAPLK